MSRRLLVALVAALFVLAWAAPARAAQAAPSQKTASPAQPPTKKARKVWTNEDLEALRPSGITVSTPPAAAPASASEAAAAADTDEKAGGKKKEKEVDPVEKILKRLAPLRAELDAVEARLRSLRQARSTGNTTGGGMDISQSPGGLNTENQLSQLEQRRSDLLRQIAALEDEARRKGIAPGAIR